MKIIFLLPFIACVTGDIVPLNPDPCYWTNNQECLAPNEYPSQQFTEELPFESFWFRRRAYCPTRYTWPCFQKVNECCSDNDCDGGQVCCFENCGTTCHFPVSFITNGLRVRYHPYCRVDPRFVKIPMPVVQGY